MIIFEVLLLALALSCDAVVCSIIYGTKNYSREIRRYNAWLFAVSFGFFQFMMPVVGFFCGQALLTLIQEYDHWVAFFLLSAVSINMLKEAFSKEEEKHEECNGRIKLLTALILAVATSLDALAVGVSLAMIETQIFYISTVIGLTCFALSFASFYGASVLSKWDKLEKIMNVAGAAVLFLIGIKILIEHGILA